MLTHSMDIRIILIIKPHSKKLSFSLCSAHVCIWQYFKNRIGLADPTVNRFDRQLVRPSAGHDSGPIRWIGPEDEWTEIGLSETAVQPMNRTNWLVSFEPNGSTFFFGIKKTLFWSPPTSPPYLKYNDPMRRPIGAWW